MWYTHQKMCIRWGNAISPSFTVSNDVKQGGIISPILFNVYMDGLSVLLNSSNIGRQIGYTFLKVLEKCTKNLIGHSRLAFNNHESNIDC